MNKLRKSFLEYQVDKEFANVVEDYLLRGFSPGGFFTSLLANDAMGAIQRSHPMNKVEALKRLVVWIVNVAPEESYGSYQKVEAWEQLGKDERRAIMERANLLETAWELLQMNAKQVASLKEEMFSW